MRVVHSAWGVFSLLFLAAALQAQDEFPFGAQKTEYNRMLRMRDGVALATDIERPTGFGAPAKKPLPAVPNH